MHENPYQSPHSDLEPQSDRGFRVEGELVVIASGDSLPPFCVKSGEPVGPKEMQNGKSYWVPRWPFVVACICLYGLLRLDFVTIGGGILPGVVTMLLLQLAIRPLRKPCSFQYGLSYSVRLRRKRWVPIKGAGVVVLIAFSILAYLWGWLLFSWLCILTTCSLFFLLARSPDLSAERYFDGEFWLRGCSPKFFEAMAKGNSR